MREHIVHIFDLSNTLGLSDPDQKEFGIDSVLWKGAFKRFVELRGRNEQKIITHCESEEFDKLKKSVIDAYDTAQNNGIIPLYLNPKAREGLEKSHSLGIKTVIYSILNAETTKRIVKNSLKISDLIHGYAFHEMLKTTKDPTLKTPENFIEITYLLNKGKIISGASYVPALFVDDREMFAANASIAGIKGYHYNQKSSLLEEKLALTSHGTKAEIIVVPTIDNVYRREQILP